MEFEEGIKELTAAFGAQIEYEVIEMVLQFYNGDRIMARTQLNNMVESATSASSSEGREEVKTANSHGTEAGNPSREINSDVCQTNLAETTKLLILMRGLPGSGKSTLAQTLAQESGIVNSTDDFFYDSYGNYVYNIHTLQEAHEWNRKRTEHSMKNSISPIIIDNTNIEAWEMQPYAVLALRYKYNIQITEPDTPWKYNPYRLSLKTVHNIPKQKIEYMLLKYRSNITVEDILPRELRKVQSVAHHESPKIRDKLCSPSRNNAVNHKKEDSNCLQKTMPTNVNDEIHCDEPMTMNSVGQNSNNQRHINQSEVPQTAKMEVQGCFDEWLPGGGNHLSGYSEDEHSISEGPPTKKHFERNSPFVHGINKAIDITAKRNTEQHTTEALNQDFIEDQNISAVPRELATTFASCPKEILTSVIEYCKHDLNWAASALIDLGYEMSTTSDTAIISEKQMGSEDKNNNGMFLSPPATRDSTAQKNVDNVQKQNYAKKGSRRSCKEFTQHLDELASKSALEAPKGMVKIKLHQDSVVQLIHLFGPAIGSAAASNFTGDTTVVNLPMDFCKTLHQHWAATFNSNIKNERNAMMESRIRHFGYRNATKQIKKDPPVIEVPKDELENKDPFVLDPPKSFQEIMEVEKAITDSLQIEERKKSLALSVKLNQLKYDFPHVEPNTVEMILRLKSYNYDMAKDHLTTFFGGKKKKPPTIVVVEDDDSDDVIVGSCSSQISALELREQAGNHFVLKKEALTASSENTRKKNYPVASYYSQVAAHHKQMQRQCNQEAATQVLEGAKAAQNDSNTLDLHMLYVNEAINATRNFIADRTKYLRDCRQKTMQLSIVTGYGKCGGGAPRIKSAIVKYLRSSGHKFQEADHNRGVLCVTLNV